MSSYLLRYWTGRKGGEGRIGETVTVMVTDGYALRKLGIVNSDSSDCGHYNLHLHYAFGTRAWMGGCMRESVTNDTATTNPNLINQATQERDVCVVVNLQPSIGGRGIKKKKLRE